MDFKQVVLELVPFYQAKAKNTWSEFEITTRKHLLPFFGDKDIESVGKLWKSYVVYQNKKTPGRQLRNDKKICRVILGYANEQGYVSRVPVLKLDSKDKCRRRHVTIVEDDVYTRIRARATWPWDMILDLLKGTGARYTEVLSLEWDEIDLETKLINLPPEKTKTRTGRTYPVPDHVVNALILRKNRAPGRFVFPGRGNPAKPMTKGYKGWKKLFYGESKFFRPHDLRHTFATKNIARGVPIPVLSKLMGASAEVLSRVYLHVESLSWADFINSHNLPHPVSRRR